MHRGRQHRECSSTRQEIGKAKAVSFFFRCALPSSMVKMVHVAEGKKVPVADVLVRAAVMELHGRNCTRVLIIF